MTDPLCTKTPPVLGKFLNSGKTRELPSGNLTVCDRDNSKRLSRAFTSGEYLRHAVGP
jgi:hypothetical protein